MYKELIKGKKGVLFDLDGTLVDTDNLWLSALEKVASNVGIPAYNLIHTPGGTIVEKWKEALESSNDKIKISVDDLAKSTFTEFMNLVKETNLDVIDGFWALGVELKLEKKLKLGVVTNTPTEVARQVLAHLKLTDAFDVVLGLTDVKKPKPDPEIYLLAAKKLNLKPKEILVFEDSVIGATASSRAKMDTVIRWNGQIPENRYPKNMRGFITNYTPLPKNLDSTLKEEVLKVAEENKNRTKNAKDSKLDSTKSAGAK